MANRAEATAKAYKKDVTVFTDWLKSQELKALPKEEKVLEYMDALRDGHPNNRPKRTATLKRKLAAINAFYIKKKVNFDKGVVLKALSDESRYPKF